jgi:cytoskeleton protein RodZ
MSGEGAEQPAVPNHGIPGKTLAAARESLGWSVEQIADQLKMAVRQVVALEAGDYASLPGPAVVRGFVRAYAKVVRLDPAPLVAQIALDAPEAGLGGAAVRQQKPASFSETRFPSHGKRAKLPLGAIAVAALVVAAGVGAWKFGVLPAGLFGPTEPAPAAVQAPLETGATEAATLQGPSVPLISVPPPSNGGAIDAGATGVNATPLVGTPAGVTPAAAPAATAPATAAPVAAAPAAAAPAAAPAGANSLVLAVREDSWIEVRNAAGKALIRRMVKGGETASVDIGEPSTLIVGKPSAVTATLRGAPVALPPQAGSTISRVKVQ